MSITWNKDRPGHHLTPTFNYKLADDPSLSVVGMRIDYPPSGSTAPHSHGTASVIGYVISGTVLSAMNDGEAKVYHAGESWYEAPGCRHRISDNHSGTETASLHATFVIKTEILEREGPGVLVKIEDEYVEGAKEQDERMAKKS
ncbi:MAG: hypothetical protein M1812_008285 [Candelaria pacifica]|nr:MAG: hypothetical protein M1812_008285 [Candelaria pacifica]